MTKQEAADLLDKISSLWPNYRPANPVVAAESWATVLADVPADLAGQAVFAIARRKREFAPDAGLVLDTIRELTGQRFPTPDEALAEVNTVVRRVGYTAGRPPEFHNGQFLEPVKPEFSCDPIRLAVEAVGWKSICMAEGESRSVVQSQFIRLYREIVDRAALHAASQPLAEPGRRVGAGDAVAVVAEVSS